MNVTALKNLNLDRVLDMDEAIALSATARSFEVECEHLEQPVPDWLTKASDVLREEIARRTRSNDLAELKRTEAEIESYKSANEKRTEAQRRLAALQSKLGLSKSAKAK